MDLLVEEESEIQETEMDWRGVSGLKEINNM